MRSMDNIAKIREFNRFYTVWLDILNCGYLGTDRSWTEARIIYEIYAREKHCCTAQELCNALHMDKSYMSRILRKFEKEELLRRETLPYNSRCKQLFLTAAGVLVAQNFDSASTEQLMCKLKHLDDDTINQLCAAMEFIRNNLNPQEV